MADNAPLPSLGAVVTLAGLVRAPELNGRRAIVCGTSLKDGRLRVSADGGRNFLSIKLINLIYEEQAPISETSPGVIRQEDGRVRRMQLHKKFYSPSNVTPSSQLQLFALLLEILICAASQITQNPTASAPGSRRPPNVLGFILWAL